MTGISLRRADRAPKTAFSEKHSGTHPGRPPWILPAVVFSQFAGTSLWFAGNAVLGDLQQRIAPGSQAIGLITSAVQLGFIAGTLIFAFFMISDLFSPRRVFLVCSLAGAGTNLLLLIGGGWGWLLLIRFATGFFLAGIYPVGMKIAAGWYRKGLGNALGWLVGALVLGTAFPHLIKGLEQGLPFVVVLWTTSLVAAAGGAAIYLLVPDGPYLKKSPRFQVSAIAAVFREDRLRFAAGGYFGHMWELYTVWAFVPFMLTVYCALHPENVVNSSLWSFLIIAGGSIGCIAGGWISFAAGSTRVALWQLRLSGLCCLVSPLMFFLPLPLFLGFLLFWGVVVVGDSPQFSTLVARSAPPAFVGSALTIVNCIGFAITIVSIQLVSLLTAVVPPFMVFLFLLPGPVLGVWSLQRIRKSAPLAE